jgi:hypothetical protein
MLPRRKVNSPHICIYSADMELKELDWKGIRHGIKELDWKGIQHGIKEVDWKGIRHGIKELEWKGIL